MSNQYLKLRRSAVPGKVPDTASLDFGEIALNTYDGLAYMKVTGSFGQKVLAIGVTSGSFTGSLFGTASWANNAITASHAITSANVSGSEYYVAVFSGSNSVGTGSIFDSGSFTAVGATVTPHLNAPERFFVDASDTDSYNLISGHGTINNYLQLNIKNFSSGDTGSSDIVATADNGDETSFFIDMGVNSSGYNSPDGIGGSNDAYLYSTAQDLLIGNASAGKRVIIFNGSGPALDNARVYINSQGTVGINASNPSLSNPEALLVEPLVSGAAAPNDFNNLIIGRGTVNESYLQLNMINKGSGSAASADIVATNDTGDETSNYIDMGINSSGYNTPNAVGIADDAYLYSTGRHLHIGNASNYPIQFFVGGLDSDANRKLQLNVNGQHEVTGSLTATQGFTGSLYGTASWAENSISASWAPSSFPYSGSAQITGSLGITGSFNVSGSPINLSGLTNVVYNDNTFQGLNIRNVNLGTNALSGITIQSSSGDPVAQINYIPPVYANPTLRNTFLFNTIFAQKLAFATNTAGGATRADIYFTVNPAFFLSSANPNQIQILGTSRNVVINYSGTDTGENFQIYGSTKITGSVLVTGSVTATQGFTGSLFGTASWAQNALTSSISINAATASSADDFVVRNSLTASNAIINGTLTAQTLVVQTVTSSVIYSSGSNIFGNDLSNTQVFTGSVSITGSLSLNGNNVVTSDQTSSMSVLSASYASTASYALNAANVFPYTGSARITGSLDISGSIYVGNTIISSSSDIIIGQYNAIRGSFLPSSNYISFNGNILTLQSSNTVKLTNGPGEFVIDGNTGFSRLGLPSGWNVVIGSLTDTVVPSAKVTINSTDKGFLTTRTDLTSNISSPAQGLITYLTGSSNEGLWYYSSGSVKGWTRFLNDTGSQFISGSLTVTQGITGSLFGTASWAQNSITASYALNAAIDTGSLLVTASAVNTTITFTKGNGTTFDVTVSQSGSVASASYADFAVTASYASTASYVLNAISSSYAFTASSAVSSSFAQTASYSENAISASYAPNIYNSDGIISSNRIVDVNNKTLRFTNTNNVYYSSSVGTFISLQASSNTAFVSVNYYDTGSNLVGGWGYGNSNVISPVYRDKIYFAGVAIPFSIIMNSVETNRFFVNGNFKIQTGGTYTDNGYKLQVSAQSTSSGSLWVSGSSVMSGSLSVTQGITGSLFGTASWAQNSITSSNALTASYVLNAVSSSYAFTASSAVNATNALTASSADNFVVRNSLTASSALINGTITAQTLVVSTISSSVVYSSGSNIFGNSLSNTQVFTGSVSITGSLSLNGNSVVTSNQTGSMSVLSASFAQTASYVLNAISSSYSFTASSAISSSFANNTISSSYAFTASSAISSSQAQTASYVLNAVSSSFAATASWALNFITSSVTSASYAFTASSAVSSSFALTASYLAGYVSPFPYTGSAVITGSLVVTGSTSVQSLNIGASQFNNTSSITVAGTTTISQLATGSYTSCFYNYTIASASNARSGQVMSVWNGTTIRYTEVTTTDIGNTATASFVVALSGENVILNFSAPGVWTVKNISNLL